jgi:hypothetical protein
MGELSFYTGCAELAIETEHANSHSKPEHLSRDGDVRCSLRSEYIG